MLTSFLLFFVCYFLVVFVALLGFFWQDARFFWLAGINLLSLLIFFVVSFVVKKQEDNLKTASEELKEEKVRHPNQFVKYPYMKHEKKGKAIVGYLLFAALFLFLFSVLDLTLFHTLGQFIWIFPLLYLFLLLISGKDLIDNKIKILGLTFNFYFFLFISSLIVGVLVYGTLIFSILPILLLSALLVSFLFFFVGYVFIKNQGFRFFFRLPYARIYFVAIFVALIRSFAVLPAKHTLGESITNMASDISSFFNTLREKPNKDPLLYTGEGSVIGSGVSLLTGDREEDIFEETGMVVFTSQVNTVFLGDETSDLDDEGTGSQMDPSTAIKQKLELTDTSSVTIMDALVYLMDMNGTILSSKESVKFSYVTTKNPYYTYYVTAYQKKIIGAKTNPSTKISCETYQVFKGMIEGWKLSYSSATVKSVFRAEAKKRDVLNGCVYGKLVKGENL
ncbi:hypothetical protein P148_SR1C00001G0906 [candidate division SR1 bacterium RAAC1_SR1_1]|nr:hypothetical protein P148_SR1C00001G0906 [candidate division SR1 bacterium RAAC1_SR1_1]